MADGDIAAEGASVFRDHVVQGNPTSGRRRVPKSEVRALMATVDAEVAGVRSLATTGVRRLASVAVASTANLTLSGEQTIDGVLTSTSRVLAKDQSTGSQNGVYVTAAGAWTRATDADSAAEIGSARVYVEGGTANFGRAYICQQASSAITLGSTSLTWALDGDIADLDPRIDDLETAVAAIEAVGVPFEALSDEDRLPVGAGGGGWLQEDSERIIPIAPDGRMEIIRHNEDPIDPDRLPVGGAVAGLYQPESGRWSGYTAADGRQYVRLTDEAVDDLRADLGVLDAAIDNPDPLRVVALDGDEATLLQAAGTEAAVARFTITTLSADTTVVSDVVAIDALPAATPVSGEALTVTYNTDRFLSYRYIEAASVVVTRTSDSVVLTEDTHYSVDYERGVVRGLINTANYGVTVDFDGVPHRYDLITADRLTGVLTVTAGTERAIDPEEYLPALPAGAVPLYRALVTPQEIELVPVHQWRGGIRRTDEGRHAAWLQTARHRLTRTFSSLRQGSNITLCGYGDSITHLGTVSGINQLTANSAGHSHIAYFSNLPADTRAALDPAHYGIGSGGNYHQLGWGWELKRAIDAAWGVTVTYDNRGVGGTDSGTSSFGDIGGGTPYYNGAHPTRLGPLQAAAYDLVVLAFGMNESTAGAATVYANHLHLIGEILDSGADLIVLTPPRINTLSPDRSEANMLTTHDAIIAAAEDSGVAWLSCHELWPSFGLSLRSAASQDHSIHPGITELRLIGAAAAQIFL